MSFGAVAGITLTIALVLVAGVWLMSYVSSLVKNVYQIKVELRSDLDAAIGRMDAEVDRRGKALRKELADDVTQMRDAMLQDNDRRVREIEERLKKASQDLQDAARGDKSTTQTALVDLNRRLKALETDVAAVKGELARRAALGRAMRDKDKTDHPEAEPDTLPPPPPASDQADGQRVPLNDFAPTA